MTAAATIDELRCEWCGGDADTDSTCPKSIACPTCNAPAGRSCKRPSGHRAHRLHADRIDVAERADRDAGARWTRAFAHQLALDAEPAETDPE